MANNAQLQFDAALPAKWPSKVQTRPGTQKEIKPAVKFINVLKTSTSSRAIDLRRLALPVLDCGPSESRPCLSFVQLKVVGHPLPGPWAHPTIWQVLLQLAAASVGALSLGHLELNDRKFAASISMPTVLGVLHAGCSVSYFGTVSQWHSVGFTVGSHIHSAIISLFSLASAT